MYSQIRWGWWSIDKLDGILSSSPISRYKEFCCGSLPILWVFWLLNQVSQKTFCCSVWCHCEYFQLDWWFYCPCADSYWHSIQPNGGGRPSYLEIEAIQFTILWFSLILNITLPVKIVFHIFAIVLTDALGTNKLVIAFFIILQWFFGVRVKGNLVNYGFQLLLPLQAFIFVCLISLCF